MTGIENKKTSLKKNKKLNEFINGSYNTINR